MNMKVTHSKDQTESEIELPEKRNIECRDKFLESTK